MPTCILYGFCNGNDAPVAMRYKMARPQSCTSKHLSECTQFWKELSSFLSINIECGQPHLGKGNALNLGQQNPHICVCRISVRTNIAITQ
jgi:hypothetical protein